MTSLTLLLLAAATTSAPPSKPAQSSLPNRAAVFILPTDDAAQALAGRTEAALVKELEAGEVAVTAVDTLFAPPARENVGAKHLKAGQEAFENLDLEAAAKLYEDALAWFTQHPEFTDSKQLSDIHLFLASVALGEGKSGQKKALEQLQRALVLSPDAQLDSKYFGPDAKKLWEKARVEVANRPTATLTIQSTPPAEATFRGAVVKESPSVPVGRHLVLFKRPGYLPAGVLVDVTRDGGTAKVKLEPVADYALVRTQVEAVVPSSFGALKAPPGARTIATAVQSRFLVLGSVGATGGQLEVWDGETLSVLKDVALGTTPDTVKPVALAVKNFIQHPSPIEVAVGKGGKAPPAVETGPSQPVYKKWWFWAAVGGVVVVGATTGLVAAAASGNGPPAYNVVLDMQ